MNVEEPILIEAIKDYAMLHDRPYWFDPDRLRPQANLWRALIEREGDGEVIHDDFRFAEDRLLEPPKPDEEWRHTLALRDISPKHIIDAARERAAARRARAERAVLRPEDMLYTERGVWRGVREGRQDLDGYYDDIGEIDPELRGPIIAERVARADRVFVGQVESLIYDLHNSGLPDSVTAPLVADLRVRLAGSGLAPEGPRMLDG